MVYLWRAQSSYITKVEKKLSDKRGFILAQRMDGWLFKNKPKTDFLHYSLWVPGLTVKLPRSKIIKSYLLSTDFQIGKHTWQFLVIQLMSKVFRSRIQKARWISSVRIKFWCHKVHWYSPLIQQDGKLCEREREHERKREADTTGNQGQKEKDATRKWKEFTLVSKFGIIFWKLVVSHYNSQEWNQVASSIHLFIQPRVNIGC